MPLAIAIDVRLDAGVLDREHPARPPHARLHFVRHEHDAVRRRERAQPLEELIRRHDVPALALDRLDDDGGDLVGRHEVHEDLVVEEVEALGGARLRLEADRTAVAVGDTARGTRPA